MTLCQGEKSSSNYKGHFIRFSIFIRFLTFFDADLGEGLCTALYSVHYSSQVLVKIQLFMTYCTLKFLL